MRESRQTDLPLNDQHVVIVGGTGSIGIATASLLASQGAQIVITGRDEKKLAAASAQVAGVRTCRCEITSEADVQRLFSPFKRIDHVVVLAGSGAGGRASDTPPALLRFIIEERIWGAIHVVQAAAPKMRDGSITLTSGLFSHRPPQNGGAILAAALAGVQGLARALARELSPLRVNAVSFGSIRSTRHSGMGTGQDAYYERLGSSLPTGRVGEPHEAALAIGFAVSSGYLTGEIIRLDGGARLVG